MVAAFHSRAVRRSHSRSFLSSTRLASRTTQSRAESSIFSSGIGILMRPPYILSLRDRNKKSIPHYGFGEIINDRCITPTTRTLLRYLKTDIYAFRVYAGAFSLNDYQKDIKVPTLRTEFERHGGVSEK